MKNVCAMALLAFSWAYPDACAEVQYRGASLRDPFSDKAPEQKVDESYLVEKRIRAMSVQGMLLSTKHPHAIINGKIYTVGSPLDKGVITQIDKNGVMVSYEKRSFLIQPTTKRTPGHDSAKPQ